MNFTLSLQALRSLDKKAAKALIVSAFEQGDLDAGEAFLLASELGVELKLS